MDPAHDESNEEFLGEYVGSDDDELGEEIEDVIDVEVSEIPKPRGGPNDDPESRLRGMLHGLQGEAGRIQLWRKKPTWCQGFLCSIDVEPGDELDLEQIKRDWGGGTISFRPQRRGRKGGFQFVSGGVHLQLTGPPLERGIAIQPDGRPVQQAAPMMPPQQYTAPVRTGNPAMDFMQQLFDRLDQRLGALETRIAQPAQQYDPLQGVKQTLALAEAFDKLRGIRPESAPDDDDDDDDDEPAGPPELEDLAMMWLQNKMQGGVDPDKAAAMGVPPVGAPPTGRPPPSHQPTAPPPRAERAYVKPQEPPRAAPAPRAPAPPPQPKAPERDPWLLSDDEPASSDPWGNVVPMVGAEAEPSEPAVIETTATTTSSATPDDLVAQLQAMDTDDALDFLARAVHSIPRERMVEFVQRMQEGE